MGNYGITNCHPMTKEKRRANRKKHLTLRKMTKKQRTAYREGLELIKQSPSLIARFVWVLYVLKITSPPDLFSKLGARYYNSCLEDFAENYTPTPILPLKGNLKKEKRFVR